MKKKEIEVMSLEKYVSLICENCDYHFVLFGVLEYEDGLRLISQNEVRCCPFCGKR